MEIVGVAILHNGTVWSLPAPKRHHDVIRDIAEATGETDIFGIQGFVTKGGYFLTRPDAAEVALRYGQITALSHPPDLYSEDLW